MWERHRCLLIWVSVVIGALVWSAAAEAARRAFIIGNSNYAAAPPLANPANDARDMAARLTALGYDVTLGLDVDRKTFLERFQTFARSLKQDDLALVFYAGHGLQIGGENYLFPVDARVTSEVEAKRVLVPLNALLSDLSRLARNRVVILDACRNNPFAEPITKSQATRSADVGRGLARVYAGVGSFIAYSTQPGNVALDGTGRNSPFTAALLKHVPERGLDVHAVMRRVRGDVQRVTGQGQVPWENSSLVDEIGFADGAGPAMTSATGGGVGSNDAGTQVASAKASSVVRSERYHYVSGLDPQGDNFLALRSGIDGKAERIATMGPDTLLSVVGKSGPWRKVVLRDGLSGWAHSNWISCCRTATGAAGVGGNAPEGAEPAAQSCEALWSERNAIWHRHGYCFASARGKAAFGNAGCSRDQAAARSVMSTVDVARIDELVARETAAGCR